MASTLLEYAAEAFPISVHLKKLKDNTRRCMEIMEAEGVENSAVKSRLLYRFAVEDNVQTEGGIKVIGHFEQAGGLSEALRETLLENGAPMGILKKFI